jgi:hypothetical protein
MSSDAGIDGGSGKQIKFRFSAEHDLSEGSLKS